MIRVECSICNVRYEILDVAVLKDNSKFVSCGEDKAAFLWDVSTGAVVRRLQGHEQRINACCFSTEGSVLFTASYDKVMTMTVSVFPLRNTPIFHYVVFIVMPKWLSCRLRGHEVDTVTIENASGNSSKSRHSATAN